MTRPNWSRSDMKMQSSLMQLQKVHLVQRLAADFRLGRRYRDSRTNIRRNRKLENKDGPERQPEGELTGVRGLVPVTLTTPCSCIFRLQGGVDLVAATWKYDSKRTKTDDFNAKISKLFRREGPLPQNLSRVRHAQPPLWPSTTRPPVSFWQLAPWHQPILWLATGHNSGLSQDSTVDYVLWYLQRSWWKELITACWKALNQRVRQAASYWCWVPTTGACASAGACHVTTMSAAALTSSLRWTVDVLERRDAGSVYLSRPCSKPHRAPLILSPIWKRTTRVSKVLRDSHHS